jgi:hypothetical protein
MTHSFRDEDQDNGRQQDTAAKRHDAVSNLLLEPTRADPLDAGEGTAERNRRTSDKSEGQGLDERAHRSARRVSLAHGSVSITHVM